MERVIEKFKEVSGIEKTIVDHLIGFAKAEPKFIDKLLSEKKTIGDCIDYITAQAKKEVVKGVARIEDERVFGWAVHYFDEEHLVDWEKTSARISSTVEPKQTTSQNTKAIHAKPNKNIHEGQISLFDELI
ncbi:MAG: hypothetical protein BWY97_00059 [Tenericutes bacterium ADurb.BinA124]|nr:MAG: hypothetical protein BWY97_00059 [Tenericutes bacterium ADurb.BinA124]